MKERIAIIADHPDYAVTTEGRVFSDKGVNVRILSLVTDKEGYTRFSAYTKGKRKTVFVHQCVLETFVGPRPEGMQACHNDGDKTNNSLSNLRWDTPAGNAADKDVHGTTARGETSGNAKLTAKDVLEIRAIYARGAATQSELGKRYGISQAQISRLVNRLDWNHI